MTEEKRIGYFRFARKRPVVIPEFRVSEISGTSGDSRGLWVPALRFAPAGMTNAWCKLNRENSRLAASCTKRASPPQGVRAAIHTVIPAQAGIQMRFHKPAVALGPSLQPIRGSLSDDTLPVTWIPACAGMTGERW